MALFMGARRPPPERTTKALFNKRHTSIRSIKEQTFGILKMCFPILKGPMQNYLIGTQNNIVLARHALHNFIQDHMPKDEHEEENAVGAFEDAFEKRNQVLVSQPIDMFKQGITKWNEDRQAITNYMYINRQVIDWEKSMVHFFLSENEPGKGQIGPDTQSTFASFWFASPRFILYFLN